MRKNQTFEARKEPQPMDIAQSDQLHSTASTFHQGLGGNEMW